ncbi:hypothetical protein LJR290_007411 [Variovorax sp. LjRoot290]
MDDVVSDAVEMKATSIARASMRRAEWTFFSARLISGVCAASRADWTSLQ